MSEARPVSRRLEWTLGASLLAHLGVLLLLGVRHRAEVVPMRLPGTAHGTIVSLVYVPASGVPHLAPHGVSARKKAVNGRSDHPVLAAPAQPAAPAVSGGVPAVASLGEGDVTVALMQFFPDPRPDLSQLPPGTRGDVILQAVIGADGRIAQLTLKQGLGHGVDQAVVATVEQWTFKPAMRDGKPVPSEQELHFHYEHG